MHAIKFFRDSSSIKFEDESMKQNILIVCTGLTLAPLFKMANVKNQRKDSMDVVHCTTFRFFLCVLVLGQFKDKMVSVECFSVS